MEEKAGVQGRAEMGCGQVRPGEKVACHQPAHCEGASRAETGRKSDLDLQQLSGLTREPAEERGCEVRSNGLTGPRARGLLEFFCMCTARSATLPVGLPCPVLPGRPSCKERTGTRKHTGGAIHKASLSRHVTRTSSLILTTAPGGEGTASISKVTAPLPQ